MSQQRTSYILASCVGLAVTSNIIVFSVTALAALKIAPHPVWATLPIVMQYVSSTLVCLPASLFMRRFGRKIGFSIALFVSGFGGLVCAYALVHSNFLIFNLGAMLIGVYGGFAPYYRFAAVDTAAPEAKGKIMSLVMAGGVVAAIAGPQLAKVGKNLFEIDFVGNYMIVAMLPLLALVFMSQTRLSKPQQHLDSGRSVAVLAKQPKFLLAVAAGMVSYAVMTLLMVATPLAMRVRDIGFGSITDVIQWHVLAMFLPSFFTGRLIQRFGVYRILLTGLFLYLGAVGMHFSGETLFQFWSGMMLIGLGWNFLYLGASHLLTETYVPEEMGKVQGFNETSILAIMSCVSLGAGFLFEQVGWVGVNLAALPLVGLVMALILWLIQLEKRVPA